MTNSDIPKYVRERKEWKLSSSTGVINSDGDFVVYSYDTIIAIYNDEGRVAMNECKYSSTTTRLQGMIRGIE